MKRAETI